jgi:hypothetical protein
MARRSWHDDILSMKKLFLIFAILCFSAPVCADMNGYVAGAGAVVGGGCESDSTAIGNDTSETSASAMTASRLYCHDYIAECDGDIDELYVRLKYINASEYATAGIYTESGGTFTRVQDTDEVEGGSDTDGWHGPFTLDSSVSITKDSTYYLCVAISSGSGGQFYLSSSTGSTTYYKDISYSSGALPASFDSASTHNWDDPCIYGQAQ